MTRLTREERYEIEVRDLDAYHAAVEMERVEADDEAGREARYAEQLALMAM